MGWRFQPVDTTIALIQPPDFRDQRDHRDFIFGTSGAGSLDLWDKTDSHQQNRCKCTHLNDPLYYSIKCIYNMSVYTRIYM